MARRARVSMLVALLLAMLVAGSAPTAFADIAGPGVSTVVPGG